MATVFVHEGVATGLRPRRGVATDLRPRTGGDRSSSPKGGGDRTYPLGRSRSSSPKGWRPVFVLAALAVLRDLLELLVKILGQNLAEPPLLHRAVLLGFG